MRNVLNKLTKGVFALFIVKFLLIGAIFIAQSCQNEDNILNNKNKESAISNFKKIVINSNPKIYGTLATSPSTRAQKSNISDEKEIKEILKPLLESSKELLHAYDFTDQEIEDELGSLDNPEVILSAMLIVAMENQRKVETASMDIGGLFFNNLYAQRGPGYDDAQLSYYDKSVNCVLRATGIGAAGELLNHGIKNGLKRLGIKGVLKMVGKIAGRTLSWVGVAWAVGDFISCMNQ